MNSIRQQASTAHARLARTGRRRHWLTNLAIIRSIHARRELPYPVEKGLGDFLPPAAIQTLVAWQEGLLQQLNEQVKGTAHQNKTVLQTIIDTAPERDSALAFNFASLALNNSFFMDYLKPTDEGKFNHEDRLAPPLASAIRRNFGSFEQLKSTVAATAMGMASSGWVWMVSDTTGNLAVLPTFGAGTLLVRSRVQTAKSLSPVLLEEPAGDANPPIRTAHSRPPLTPLQRRGPSLSTGSSTATNPTSGVHSTPTTLDPHTPARSMSGYSAYEPPSILGGDAELHAQNPSVTNRQFYRIGANLHPLFCISIHEHAWMSAGYGVWGKREYLKRFWTALDWWKVSNTYATFDRSYSTSGTTAV